MSIAWGDIVQWNPAKLYQASQDLSTQRKELAESADQAMAVRDRIQSSGEAVEAMKQRLVSIAQKHDRLVSEVGELMMATSEAADGVWDVQTKVHECISFTEQYPFLSINGDGSVSVDKSAALGHIGSGTVEKVGDALTEPVNWVLGGAMAAKTSSAPFVTAAELGTMVGVLNDRIRRAMERAVEVDEAYTKRLSAVNDGTYEATETSDSFSQGLPDLPDPSWSPSEVSAWWVSLTEAERAQIIKEHPEAIGNLDGISMSARDQANRSLLLDELAAAEEGQTKADDLQALYDTLYDENGQPIPDRQLIGLDTSGDGDVRASIGLGAVDRAPNVAVLAGGIDTTLRGNLGGKVNEAENVRESAGADDTAAIVYMGYDAPPGPLPFGDNGSPIDIITTTKAREGAQDINGLVEGIHTYRQTQGNDPEISVWGHSYASTTAGMAAATAKVGVYSSLGMYGSPGGGVQDVHEYNVPEGHVYASRNAADYVGGVGLNEFFGRDPIVMDGVEHIASTTGGGHSSYMNNPEFVEDVGQIVAGEDPSVDRPDNRSARAAGEG